jgi:hypothetical protein
VLRATLFYYAGRPREGLEGIQQAIKRNPHQPSNYPFHLGQTYFVLEDYDAAIAASGKVLHRPRPRSGCGSGAPPPTPRPG